MRLWVLILGAGIVAAQGPRASDDQSAVCPSEPPLAVAPSSQHWFDGSLRQTRVRMFLERGGENVVGVLYDTGNWRPVTLGGQMEGG